MADRSFWLDQFEKNANLPLSWRLVADNLLIAANLLFEAHSKAELKNVPVGKPIPRESRVLPAILLLRAAAVEALLKGRAVRRGHRFVVDGKFIPIPNGGSRHDLILLARATTFPLSRDESDLLRRLRPYLELARYPIGKSWDFGLKKDSRIGVGHVADAYYISSDEHTLARLIKRLRCALH